MFGVQQFSSGMNRVIVLVSASYQVVSPIFWWNSENNDLITLFMCTLNTVETLTEASALVLPFGKRSKNRNGFSAMFD